MARKLMLRLVSPTSRFISSSAHGKKNVCGINVHDEFTDKDKQTDSQKDRHIFKPTDIQTDS